MYIISKQIGETPLEALKRSRNNHPQHHGKRLSYAGRLDPMASGELLILEGEENDNREKFLSLDKTYEFQILFGVSTDTYDLLGLVEKIDSSNSCITKPEIEEVFDQFVGMWEMTYPPYSAKTVEVGDKQQPLWQLARRNALPEQLPIRSVEIYELTCESIEYIKKNYIIYYIIKNIAKVEGDFRQEDIIKRWQDVLFDVEREFPLVKARVRCSSGTYVRRLAYEIGNKLGLPALAFSIKRTDIELPPV